jgi:putative PIN family toxin of toxin-antitoxin system
MRAVLDVNVLVSAAIQRQGKSRQILNRATNLQFEWVTCEHILVRAGYVLTRKHIQAKYRDAVTPDERRKFFELAGSVAQVVEVRSSVEVIGDRDDDVVLACAIDGQADYLVSGDLHLKDLGEFEGIRIVSPDEFLKLLTP